jgi:hypothetical protein
MSRIKLTLCAVALCLTALTVGVLGAASASAESAPYLKWCALVPSGLIGLYEKDTCEGVSVSNGKYAWAWAASLTETSYCVLGGHSFEDGLCELASSGGPFLIHTTKERPPLIQGIILTSILTGKVAGTETLINCSGGSSSGEAENAKESVKEPLKYTGCTVVKPTTKCLADNVGGTAGTIETLPLKSTLTGLDTVSFAPESGTVFVEIEYKDKGTEECVLNETKAKVTGSQTCEWAAGLNLASLDHLLNCTKANSNLKFGGNTATYEGVNHVHLSNDALWKIQ